MIENFQNYLRKHYYKWIEDRAARKMLNALKAHVANDDDLILVHQMGRAASMTITNTIKSMNLNSPVYHTHWLNKQSVDERVARINSWKKNGIGPLNVRVSELLSPEIEKRLIARQWKIVSVIREPVARNVSAFFLDIERFFPDFFERHQNNELPLELIADVFLKEFPHKMPLDWFDVEIQAPFEIDVFNADFDEQKGYMIIEDENVSLLVIKLEKLNTCFKGAFSEFFEQSPEALINTHVTSEDKTFGMYDDFLCEVELPESYLDEMYDCEYVRHFFSDEEVQNFRRKWSKKA